ncbi:MAG: GNAT family N-acetyltransferase [Polyangiales bacterium]
MEILRATVDDWARVRAIRLAALADAPDAFSATLDDEDGQPPSFWQQRLGASDASTLLATRGGEDLGTAVLSAPAATADAWLYAVWVAPGARGLGVGDALLDEAAWRARGMRRARLCLDVGDRNTPARALYARHGFRPRGDGSPSRRRGITSTSTSSRCRCGPTPTSSPTAAPGCSRPRTPSRPSRGARPWGSACVSST